MFAGHSRDVLCLDLTGDLVVSGGQDTKVLVTRLGPPHQSQAGHHIDLINFANIHCCLFCNVAKKKT